MRQALVIAGFLAGGACLALTSYLSPGLHVLS